MSIKNTLKRDLKWFQSYGLIKRIIVSVIMAILTMLIIAGLDFEESEIFSFGLLAFLIFFILIYLLLAWVFGDIENNQIVNANSIESTISKQNTKYPFKIGLLPILSFMAISVVLIVMLKKYSDNKKTNATEEIDSTTAAIIEVVPSSEPEYYPTPQNETEVTNPIGGSGDLFETEKFKIGSTKDDVRRIQGEPSGVKKWDFNNTEDWTYGPSFVTFKNGKVLEYLDLGNNLKVKYE